MKCKNCGHKIGQDEDGEWAHYWDTKVGGRQCYNRGCKCSIPEASRGEKGDKRCPKCGDEHYYELGSESMTGYGEQYSVCGHCGYRTDGEKGEFVKKTCETAGYRNTKQPRKLVEQQDTPIPPATLQPENAATRPRNPDSLKKEECEAEIRNFAKQSVLKCYKDNKKLIDALGNKNPNSFWEGILKVKQEDIERAKMTYPKSLPDWAENYLYERRNNKKDGVTLRPICGRHLRVVKEGE